MMQRILVPLDGSPLAERAIPYAESLARTTMARIVLLRAVEVHALSGHRRAKARVGAQQEAENYLDAIAAPLRERGLTVDIALPYGGAAEMIEDEIAIRGIDLVVMATHGRGGLGRMVFGSVAERVLHHSAVPVLLIRAWQEATGDAFAAAPRIVVPLDGSRFAEAALPTARELAAAVGGELLLVQAVTPPEVAFMAEVAYATFDPEAEVTAAMAYLRHLAQQESAAGRTTRIHAEVGTPASVIAEVAANNNAALIVMATHGRNGFGRFVLGSIANAVLRQGATPLLLVRPQDDEVVEVDATATQSAATPR